MAYNALDPYAEQDEFTSSFFQQAQQPYAAPAMKPPAMEPPPSAPPQDAASRDPFTSSVFAPGTGVEQARRAMSDYGASSGSSRQPPSTPAVAGSMSGSSSGAGSFDYGSLVSKVKTSVDPREQAIAKDQLARATYSQLKNAGHEVNWDGDNLVVDGRPYVIGDGASAATEGAQGHAAIVSQPGRPQAVSSKAAPTNGPSLDYYQHATGRTQGGAATPQDAYEQLAGSMDPNASPEEMEAAIEAAFGHLPGYGGAYKESVMLNGRWYDMVTGYGGAGASWGGLTPKGPSSSAMGASMFGAGGLMSSALSPFSGGSGSGSQLSGGVEGARGVELSAGLSPSILALLQQQQAPEPEPMQPSYMNLLR